MSIVEKSFDQRLVLQKGRSRSKNQQPPFYLGEERTPKHQESLVNDSAESLELKKVYGGPAPAKEILQARQMTGPQVSSKRKRIESAYTNDGKNKPRGGVEGMPPNSVKATTNFKKMQINGLAGSVSHASRKPPSYDYKITSNVHSIRF